MNPSISVVNRRQRARCPLRGAPRRQLQHDLGRCSCTLGKSQRRAGRVERRNLEGTLLLALMTGLSMKSLRRPRLAREPGWGVIHMLARHPRTRCDEPLHSNLKPFTRHPRPRADAATDLPLDAASGLSARTNAMCTSCLLVTSRCATVRN